MKKTQKLNDSAKINLDGKQANQKTIPFKSKDTDDKCIALLHEHLLDVTKSDDENFQDLSLIGSGGVAKIFSSVNQDLGRKVAIKALHHQFRDLEIDYIDKQTASYQSYT